MTAKKHWVRPAGCECDEATPARYRCTKEWMRCAARVRYWQRVYGVPIRVNPNKLRKLPKGARVRPPEER
jgi:hypothetical protein